MKFYILPDAVILPHKSDCKNSTQSKGSRLDRDQPGLDSRSHHHQHVVCGWGGSWGDDQADWVIRLAHLRPKIMIRAVRQKRAGAMHSHRWCTDNNVLHGGLHPLKVDTAPWRGLKFSLHSCVDGIVYSCSQYDEETMIVVQWGGRHGAPLGCLPR